MDQETDESKRIVENLSQVSRAPDENSSSSVNGVVTKSVEASSVSRGDLGSNYEVGSRKALVEAQETVINHDAGDRRVIAENSSNLVHEVMLETVSVRNSEESTSFSGENGGIGLKIDELGSGDEVVEAANMYNRQRVGERIGQIDQVLETVILVNLDQATCVSGEGNELESKSNELGSSKALVEMSKRKEPKVDKESCVIDIKCGGGDEKGFKESRNEERVCRICHLDSEQSLETTSSTATIDNSTLELIHLGCGCKAELGIAHSHCAEAWFKLKGNRLCEICGQTAKNVTGVGDFRFMEEWNEHRFIGGGSSSSERSGCWRGQPFCNFLMACLVIAFVLPWFFRVNMF